MALVTHGEYFFTSIPQSGNISLIFHIVTNGRPAANQRNTVHWTGSSASSLIVGRARLSATKPCNIAAAAPIWMKQFANRVYFCVTLMMMMMMMTGGASRLKCHLFSISFPSTMYSVSSVTATPCHFGHFNRSCYLLTYLLITSSATEVFLAHTGAIQIRLLFLLLLLAFNWRTSKQSVCLQQERSSNATKWPDSVPDTLIQGWK